MDGFFIYGLYVLDKGFEFFSVDDFDICYGCMVDGKYWYYLIYDFLYVFGCYWGVSVKDNVL